MKKLYWAIFIIIAVGVTVWLLYAINKPIPTASELSPVLANEWKTYNNSKYGFSLQYPAVMDKTFGFQISVNDYSAIDDGPGAFYQRMGKTVWQSRLNNKNKYKVGDACLSTDNGETTKKNISCIVFSLKPYAFKITRADATELDFALNNLDLLIIFPPNTVTDDVLK